MELRSNETTPHETVSRCHSGDMQAINAGSSLCAHKFTVQNVNLGNEKWLVLTTMPTQTQKLKKVIYLWTLIAIYCTVVRNWLVTLGPCSRPYPCQYCNFFLHKYP